MQNNNTTELSFSDPFLGIYRLSVNLLRLKKLVSFLQFFEEKTLMLFLECLTTSVALKWYSKMFAIFFIHIMWLK